MSERSTLLLFACFSSVIWACEPQPEQSGSAGPSLRPLIQVDSAPPITMTIERQDLHSVLLSFSDVTGFSFVVGSDVEGIVSATFHNEPWNLALDAILRSHGLHAVETAPGIWRVERLESFLQHEKLRTRIMKLERQ